MWLITSVTLATLIGFCLWGTSVADIPLLRRQASAEDSGFHKMTRKLQCNPSALLKDDEIITQNDGPKLSTDGSASIEQRSDGFLVVKDSSGVEICKSEAATSGASGNYWTQLQGDGNLITWDGAPTR